MDSLTVNTQLTRKYNLVTQLKLFYIAVGVGSYEGAPRGMVTGLLCSSPLKLRPSDHNYAVGMPEGDTPAEGEGEAAPASYIRQVVVTGC